MIDKVITLLKSDSTVNTAASGGIWSDEVPQGKGKPHIIISAIDGTVNDSKNFRSQLDQVIIQVTAYATIQYTTSGVTGAYSLMEDVREVLDHYDGVIGTQKLFIRALNTPDTINFSIPNNPLYACEQEYEVYVTRGVTTPEGGGIGYFIVN
jgi:hypothetical protein